MADFTADKICKQYSTPTTPLVILSGVSVSLNRGENLAIVGPSGSGKSTFLQIAGTLDRPTSGEITLLGTSLTEISVDDLAAFRNQQVGFIFQEHHLLPQLSAIENVLIPVMARTIKDRASQLEWVARGQELLEQVGLKDRMDHRPAQLSGGERQRVAVARALVCRPALILADEPTGSLDGLNSEKIGELLLDLHRTESTILICVTHNEKLASEFQQQKRLENGKLV